MQVLIEFCPYLRRYLRGSALRAAIAISCIWLALAPAVLAQAPAPAQQPSPADRDAEIQSTIALQAQLVSEFEVNGLKVLVKKRAGSQTVAAGLFFRGGVANTTAENAGIEGLTLTVAAEASKRYPRNRMRAELTRMASAIDGSGGLDYSAFVMTSTSLAFAKTWDIFTDAAVNPRFDPADLAQIRERLLAGLRESATNPDAYLEELQSQTAFVGHPYFNQPSGTIESIGRLTVADLREYHKQMMQTSRMLLVVVGDVDAASFRKQVEAAFGRLPRGDYQAKAVPALVLNGPSVEVVARQLPTNYVQAIFSAPPLNSPDIYAMKVAVDFLQNRVYYVVRVEKNLSYAPDAFLRTQGANIGGIYVTSVDANTAVALMLDEIANLQNRYITQEALASLAGGNLLSYYTRLETNAAQVGELARYELVGGGWRNSTDSIEKLRQVTPDDVVRVSRKYLRNLHFVVIGNPKAIDKSVFMRPVGGPPI